MSSNLIEVKCPRCGQVWHADVEDLKQEQVFYRSAGQIPKTLHFRVHCPVCSTSIIVDIVEEADDG